MSRNTAMSMLSHLRSSIVHLAHFLFLLLLKYFSEDARKNAFLQQVTSLGVIVRAIYELRDKIPVRPKREIG